MRSCRPQVAKANDYVNQGNKALGQAKELQKDTRKWMCCAMMLLLGICLIVVLAVVKPWEVCTGPLPRMRQRAPATRFADTLRAERHRLSAPRHPSAARKHNARGARSSKAAGPACTR